MSNKTKPFQSSDVDLNCLIFSLARLILAKYLLNNNEKFDKTVQLSSRRLITVKLLGEMVCSPDCNARAFKANNQKVKTG